VRLRTRFAVVTGAVTVAAIAVVGVAAYAVTTTQLQNQIDDNLDSRVAQLAERVGRRPGAMLNFAQRDDDLFSDRDAITQLVLRDATTVVAGMTPLPVTDADRALLGAPAGQVRDTVTVDGKSFRTLSTVVRGGNVLKIGLYTRDVDVAREAIRTWFLVIGFVGLLIASTAGWYLAGRTTRPITRLAGSAEEIAATGDLGTSIDLGRDTEVRRLADSFNSMLAALKTSRDRQRQLVQDASHELRTPLTSLRTNTELLERVGLADGERTAILADMRAEIDELAALTGELNALASDQRAAEEPVEVDLREVADLVAERAQRRTTGAVTVVATGDTMVDARPAQLERALTNLVDNAIKFSPEGSSVDIVVTGPRIEVHDRGPGIADVDKPRVFDRFYRAAGTRSLPGSGLGLAIVGQFADDNGARTFVADAPGGGAVVGFEFFAGRR
jgi:two-component system sensor histidine kinase MprB